MFFKKARTRLFIGCLIVLMTTPVSWAQHDSAPILAGVYLKTRQHVSITTPEGKELKLRTLSYVKLGIEVPVHDIKKYLTKALTHATDFQPNPALIVHIGEHVYVLWIDQRGLVCHRKFKPGAMSRDDATTQVLVQASELPSHIQLHIKDSGITAESDKTSH